MRFRMLKAVVVLGAILTLPVIGYAQEQSIRGTVTDTTGGVLPGVTVVAQNEATGNVFVGVTDGTGVFSVPVLIGTYSVTAELSGFQTVVQTGVQVLVGQIATIAVELGVSTLEQTITVTGEAPLLNTTSSTVSGNIDPRQIEELPVNGRNWMDLTLLAPGSRQNNASEVPQDRAGYFQVVVDGQQVTQMICCASQQPRFSKDAIAEFELISNRFDATQGRTSGMMVNAVTKSGTNNFAGSASGYFRDDNFIGEDFIQQRVLPYSNTQLSFTTGGPIMLDRIHFFGNYEYEREPSTVTFNSSFPQFNEDLPGTRTEHKFGGRVDAQFTSSTRASVRYANFYLLQPNNATGGATNHPSTGRDVQRYSDQFHVSVTRVIGNNTVYEIKGGAVIYDWALDPTAHWGGGPFPNAKVRAGGSKRLDFDDYSIGTATNSPQALGQNVYSIRNDLTTSYNAMGRHDLKVGGEYLRNRSWLDWCNRCNGRMELSGTLAPANLGDFFPSALDASTWNIDRFSSNITRYDQAIGTFDYNTLRHLFSFWVQDDWQMSDRMTLNLGLRWDADIGVQGEQILLEPWLNGNRPSDLNNYGPRVGTAIQLDDNTVLRGGYGLYFTQLENDGAHQPKLWTLIAIPSIDAAAGRLRPDFATNPFDGPEPSYNEFIGTLCEVSLTPGCGRRDLTIEIPSPDHQISYSHQASVGIQRQIGQTMTFETNYVYTGGRKEEERHNVNLNYDPATGANIPFRQISDRPFPDWGVVRMEFMNGYSNYHGWENSFTKRFSNSWQMSATYSLSAFRDSGSDPRRIILDGYVPGNGNQVTGIREEALGFDVPDDLGAEYTLAASDQRHRAVVNAIWEAGGGFQVSGLYFFGSGQRFSTQWGGDRRNIATGGSRRLKPDGTITPRNDFVGEQIHRVDLRLQQTVSLGGGATVAGIFELFNLFNHENFGSYNRRVSSSGFGNPSFNGNVVYLPRMAQFGFRVAF